MHVCDCVSMYMRKLILLYCYEPKSQGNLHSGPTYIRK